MNIHLINHVTYISLRTKDGYKEKCVKEQVIQIIVRDGFDGLSMHKLAKAAGISAGTIYIYFKDRDDLILKTAITTQLEMFEATLKDFDPKMSFEKGLRIQWTNITTYFLKNVYLIQFVEQIRHSKYYNDVFKFTKKEYVKQMRSFVHNAMERKELQKLPLEIYWSLAYAPLYQLIKFHLNKTGMNGQPFAIDEEKMETALTLVIKALKPQSDIT